MNPTRLLGERFDDVVSGIGATFPIYNRTLRGSYDAHIAVGVVDVSPANCFGYDWDLHVVAYRTWEPGRHGDAPDLCDACARYYADPVRYLPCSPYSCGQVYSDAWGAVYKTTFGVRTGEDLAASRRFDEAKVVAAVQEADAALQALPPLQLTWTAYGPTHVYGRWDAPEKARTWLIGHMERLSKDPNLGAERQQQAADGAVLLAAGADQVRVGVKTYGIKQETTVAAGAAMERPDK